MKAYRVRFNLAPGATFMHWQVKSPDGVVSHYDPSTTTLVLTNVRLRNQPSTANKIYGGANKSVCAWIDAAAVTAAPAATLEGSPLVGYNPRVAPYWQGQNGQNMDGAEHGWGTTPPPGHRWQKALLVDSIPRPFAG